VLGVAPEVFMPTFCARRVPEIIKKYPMIRVFFILF